METNTNNRVLRLLDRLDEMHEELLELSRAVVEAGQLTSVGTKGHVPGRMVDSDLLHRVLLAADGVETARDTLKGEV